MPVQIVQSTQTPLEDLISEHVFAIHANMDACVKDLKLESVAILEYPQGSDNAAPKVIATNTDAVQPLIAAAQLLKDKKELREMLASGVPIVTSKPPIVAAAPLLHKSNLWGVLICEDKISSSWTANTLLGFMNHTAKLNKTISHKLDIERLYSQNSIINAITETICSATIIIDSEGIIQQATGATLENLFSEPVIGRSIQSLIQIGGVKPLGKVFGLTSEGKEIEIAGDYGTRFYLAYEIPMPWTHNQQAAIVLIDITETKHDEIAQGHVLSEMIDVVWMTDLELEYTYLSPSMRRYASRSDETGRVFSEQLNPKKLPSLTPLLQAIQLNPTTPIRRVEGGAMRDVLEFPLSDGTILYVEAVYAPRFNNQGKMIGVIGQYRDITNWYTKDLASRAADKRLSFILEHVNDGIACYNEVGTITYVSDSILRATGYTREQLIGLSSMDLIPSEYHEEMLKNYEVLLRGESGIHEYPMQGPDGKMSAWVRMHCQPIFDADGKFVEVVTVISDCTKYKIIEQENRRMSQMQPYFEHILGMNKNVVWVSDMHLNTVYVSPSISEYLGYTPEEAMQMELGLLLRQDSLDAYENALRAGIHAALDNKLQWTSDITVYQATIRNRVIKANIHMSLVLKDNGIPCGIMCEATYMKRLMKRRQMNPVFQKASA